MENKLTNIKERILEIIKIKGFGREEFFKKIGMTYGNFKGKAKKTPINSDAIVNILSIIPDLDLYWLITGEKKIEINKPNDSFKDLYYTESELHNNAKVEIKLLKNSLILKEKECERLYNILLANTSQESKKTA